MSNAPPLPTKGGEPRKPASQRIPGIALPFVGDRAKKMLDVVSGQSSHLTNSEQPNSPTSTSANSCSSR